jgi:hypothetical protein
MRTYLAAALALVAMQPNTASATSFLYTFTGVVTYANNIDATYIYANEGDAIAFSLRVQDNLPTAAYTYESTGSSAIGGPDYAPGTLLPVDRKVTVNPDHGYTGDFTPLESGFRIDDNYSASIIKDAAAKSLTLAMNFEQITPPDRYCQERCSGSRTTHTATAQVFSSAFTSPDYRELGSFDLAAGSTGTLGDSFSTYLSFGDLYEVSLSKLTVTRLPDAVPEPGTWLMMIVGLGFAGTILRKSGVAATSCA